MSDKPATKVINNKIVKSHARQKAPFNDPGPKTASQKNGFVVRKDSITKNASSARHSEPFKLVASGAGHGVYVSGANGFTRLCGALQPMGQTTDLDGGNPAIHVRFRTHLDSVQYFDISQEWLGTPKKVLSELVKRGLVVDREQSKNLADALCMYVQTMMPDQIWLRLPGGGWHKMPDQSWGYLYGDTLFSVDPKFRVATQRSGTETANVKGEAKEWLKLSRQLGNDHLLVTVTCAGFSAPLLKPLGRDATVLTMEGQSGTGKTTALKFVGGCFGPPSEMVTWNATDNGIEAVTRRYQHRPCLVDEIGQGSGKSFGKAAYGLTNATGKLRADTSGNLQETSRNHSMIISAGEVSAITRMRNAGLTVHDGQIARLPSLKVNGKHGLWDTVRGYESGGAKSKAINSFLNECYGHADAAFCAHLVQQLPSLHASYAKLAPELRDYLTSRVTYDSKDGVFDRMCENFVLFAFAGLIAVDAKAVGWSEQQVKDAVAQSFTEWHSQHLQDKPVTDHAVMKHLCLFFQSQRGDKFKPFEQFSEGHKGTVAGYEYTGRTNSEPLFLVFPSYFENVICKGLNLQAVLSVLRGQDLLLTGARNVPTKQFHVPGSENRNVSFYAIKQSIMLA
jgi:putative DNA primase/helicase